MRGALLGWAIMVASLLGVGCSDTPGSPELPGEGFTLKVHQNTGENPFAQLAYQCNACTFEDYAGLEPPEGWTKGPTQMVIPSGEMLSTPVFEGVPATIDLIAELPGDEFELIAKSLNGTVLEMSGTRLVALVDVMRDTLFRYPAGGRVHEVTDPEGQVFILFAFEVATMDADRAVFESADALSDYPVPEGWTYTTRVLADELVLATEGVATVLSIRGEVSSVWQRR